MRAQAVLLMVLLLPMIARADEPAGPTVAAPAVEAADGARLGVVVREGARDRTIVERLRGQLADLDGVALVVEATAAVEPTLDAQLATAERLAASRDARVVVWFVARGRSLAVAIATPRDHRLFVREIPLAADSTMAEAAAIAVRGAVRAIALGGTIGVEVKREPVDVPPPVEPIEVPRAQPTTATMIDAALGWQVALDGGPARGSHALVQRTTIARGAWAASLAITLGVPLEWRAADDVALDLARSGGTLGGERRFGGGLAVGAGAGALVYQRSTRAAPAGLAPTPSNSTVALVSGVEVTWRARVSGRIGIVACAGVDVVTGAPEAAIVRDAMVEVVDAIHPVQPRGSISVEVGSW
jgi:hypothetical protein